MEFVVKINKLGVYCFYLNNLALTGKKFWVREIYNREFISATGPLTILERKKFCEYQKTILHLESGKEPVVLTNFFYKPNPWQSLKKATNKKTFETIFKTFQLFEKRFNFFWDNKLENEGIIGKKNLDKNIQKKKKLYGKGN